MAPISEGLSVTFNDDSSGRHWRRVSNAAKWINSVSHRLYEPSVESTDQEGTIHWTVSSRTDEEESRSQKDSTADRYSGPQSLRHVASSGGNLGSMPRLMRVVSVMPDVRRTQEGKLRIHVKRAKDLVAKDANGFSDPYAVVKVHGKRAFRTRMIKKNLNPTWDQFVEFNGSLGSFLKSDLTVRVYDRDLFSLNDPLGRCSIDLEPLLEYSKFSLRNIPLAGVSSGTIDVSIHFEQKAINFAFPGPVAASAGLAIESAVLEIPKDATALERARDVLLNYLNSSRLMFVLLVLWIIAVVVFVILLLVVFPIHVGWAPWDAFEPTFSEKDVQHAWVLVNTILCSLFTWQNLTTLPWRLSCLIHVLPCVKRSADAGLDFYGRPTDSMFFSIPTKHRAGIVSLLVLASLLQFLQQIFRGIYDDYQTSEKKLPGNVLIITSFAGSIVCALCGGVYQFVQLFQLHEREPERFPPSAIVQAISHFFRHWRHGEAGCCDAMRGSLVEFREIQKVRRETLAAGSPSLATAARPPGTAPTWTTSTNPAPAPAPTEPAPIGTLGQSESFV